MSPPREPAPTPPEAFGLPKAPANSLEEALLLTDYLKRSLQTVRTAYLQVGELLDQVREKKLFAAMGHPDLESYALERLRLGQASLYRYLQIYDWVKANHPDWLHPGPKTFIPDLSDVLDLISIKKELKRTDLTPAKRGALEGLGVKALKGELKKSELAAYRVQGRTMTDGLKAFLSSFRLMRKRAARLSKMPPEAIAKMDETIAIISHAQTLQAAGPDTNEKR
jgi:hypothetical protein